MKILYICTHNRCRSILSEAITNHLSEGELTAFSAGSAPSGEVHPLTLKYLQERHISTQGLRSQSWNDFEAIQPDIVITVCDTAANEACPVWFGHTIQLHWGLPDPSKLQDTEENVKAAFFSVMDEITRRVNTLRSLNLAMMPESERRSALKTLID
ncbi:arsenate reductase ArsC [Marinibactrum halimedae]|uniref:Protein-tyrosine-phosphatase n=1 Tax=Marinibactrum halimedae TaxID=1444977 RepID=A0AA37WQI2_9GAMM|nr:arsenate reductase ArsC [Marinibactrum halimedae]MCD9460985.1 arsenate reductase ArsC [Marinibactrum halimedae]GLS28071.1 protein-tyrosine-phosphatase [Marinibactrum halimedae]